MYTLQNLLSLFKKDTIVNIYVTKLNTLVSCNKNTRYHEYSNLTLKYRNTVEDIISKYNQYPIYVLECRVNNNMLDILIDDFNMFNID